MRRLSSTRPSAMHEILQLFQEIKRVRQKRCVPGAGHQFQLRVGQLCGQKPRRADRHDAVAFTMHHQRGCRNAGKGGATVLLPEQPQPLVQGRRGRFSVTEHFIA